MLLSILRVQASRLTLTYKQYNEEVYHTIDGSRHNLYKVAVGTYAWSLLVPKVVYRLTSFTISRMPLVFRTWLTIGRSP